MGRCHALASSVSIASFRVLKEVRVKLPSSTHGQAALNLLRWTLARCEHEADLTRSRLELKTLQLEIDKRLGAVEDAELHSRLAWHTHAI